MLDDVQSQQAEELQEPQQVEQQVEPQEQPAEPQNDFAYHIKWHDSDVVINNDDDLRKYAQMGYNWEQKRSKEYETYKQQVESYSARKPELEYIDNFLKENGYSTWGEYQKALELETLIANNVPEEYAKEMLENRSFRDEYNRRIQTEQQQAKAQQDFAEFSTMFPDIAQKLLSAKDGEIVIPPQVFEMQQQGLSLTDAYLRYNWQNREAEKQKQEQEIIQRIANNGSTSSGSVTGQTSQAPKLPDFASMSSEDFKAYQRRVEMGEFTSK